MTAMSDEIRNFRGTHWFLSNFYTSPITLPDGYIYPTVEAAYQAMKTTIPLHRKRIREASTPEEAKHLGRKIPIVQDWDEVKVTVMLGLLRQKFEEPQLRSMLLLTGDKLLIEENSWGDRFWGVYAGTGDNHLGKLLMQVRDEIRKEKTK